MALSEAYDNKKIRRLARTLGFKPYVALGIMEVVWNWARKSARTGRIDPEQWDDIVDRLGWEAPAASFRELLISEKLVDPMPGGWDWIHDWHEYADNTTRRHLEQRGLNFANGSPPRFSKVEQNIKKVEQNGDSVRSHARAQPEPEPEPEPEPAAATRARRTREDSPPPLSPATQPDADSGLTLARIAELLHRATPRQPRPPDAALVAQVAAALQGATVAELEAWLQMRAQAGATAPRRYGFWPDVVREAFTPEKRVPAATPKRKSPTQLQPEPSPASCRRCNGEGRNLTVPESEHVSLIELSDSLRLDGKSSKLKAVEEQIRSHYQPCPDCQPGGHQP